MLLISVLVLVTADATLTQDTNPFVREVGRCLEVRDDAARLACHDAAARQLVNAARTRDVIVVDKEQVRRTRRSLFGLSLGGGDLTGRDAPAERIEALDTSIAGIRAERGGRWLLTLAEGGRWQTTEEWGGGGEPRADAKVTVRRRALGSYVLKMEGARAVRVQRVN